MRPLVGVIIVGLVLSAPRPAAGSVQGADPDQVAVLIERGDYEQAEGRARAHLAARFVADRDDSLEVSRALDLLVRALLFNGKGPATETLGYAQRAVRAKQRLLESSHPDIAFSMVNLGEVLTVSGEFVRSISTLEDAVAILARRFGADSREVANALEPLGVALTKGSSYDRAVEALARSVRIKDVLGDSDLSVAPTLEALSSALQSKGDYAEARKALDRAMSIYEKADISHPRYARSLNVLSLQLWFEGQLAESRDAAFRALTLAERTFRPDHPLIAQCLSNLAFALADTGEIIRARELQQRALAIIEKNFGPNHYELITYVNDLATFNATLGEYAAARTQFERGLKLARAKFGPYHDLVATYTHNLALIDADLGDFAAARRQERQATAIWERVFGRDHPFVAVALTQLATMYRKQGLGTAALPLFERALAIRERRFGPEHRDVARTLADMGLTLSQMGRHDGAQDLASRALRIWGNLNEPNAPDYAEVLRLSGELEVARGDYRAARSHFERALAITERAFGASHPTVAEIQLAVAQTTAQAGDTAEALLVAGRAEAAGREHLRLMSRYLPERQSLNYAASRVNALDLILSLANQMPGTDALAADAVIRNRAIVLDEMASRRRTSDSDVETSALWSELASARQRLANLVVRGPTSQTSAQYASVVEAARRNSEAAERALAERSALFRTELKQAEAGLAEVLAALPPESALVSFVRYNRRYPRAAPAYMALILRAAGDPVAVPLSSADVVERFIARWRAAVTTPRTFDRSAGVLLRQVVWDPLAAHVQGVKTLFIVPDGALSLVPFDALPGRQAEYLLEESPVIHYLSAERDLATLVPAGGSLSRGFLALGGPAFDEPTLLPAAQRKPLAQANSPGAAGARRASDCASLQRLTFPLLDGTLQEVRDIARLWSQDARTQDNMVRVLTGRDATEGAFKNEASRHRILHLATHGFFLGPDCAVAPQGTRSVGALAPASRPTPGAPPDNPLLLSGLALAGANHRASLGASEDDGILTAEEIAGLNLRGVEWAVLSACDTGVGEVRAGEGVFGLRRAFQIAGARTVIMSLWSVEDIATRQWMASLYDARLRKNLGTAESVREANKAILRDRRASGLSTHPFYWAAFIAAGDWN